MERIHLKGPICEIFTVLTHKMTPIFYQKLRKQVEVLTLTIIALGERYETTASPDFKKNLCVWQNSTTRWSHINAFKLRRNGVFVVGTDDATEWKKAVATPRK